MPPRTAAQAADAFLAGTWEQQPAVFKATPERRAFFEGLASFSQLAHVARICEGEGEPLEFGEGVCPWKGQVLSEPGLQRWSKLAWLCRRSAARGRSCRKLRSGSRASALRRPWSATVYRCLLLRCQWRCLRPRVPAAQAWM